MIVRWADNFKGGHCPQLPQTLREKMVRFPKKLINPLPPDFEGEMAILFGGNAIMGNPPQKKGDGQNLEGK